MKKNTKGFTLIELLAVVVILGILVTFSLPAITNVLNNSKNKVYVSDARKLISLVEYKMKENSSVIEKPENGNCIIVTMAYVDSSDFDNPPNGGEYIRESSYVVVKNNNGKLEYAASVVEKIKEKSYRGIELTKKSTLVGRNAPNRVIYFNDDTLLTIEGDVHSIQIGDINERIGSKFLDADSKITGVYHYKELIDDSSNYIMTNVPRIVMANIISDSDKYFNSLDAILQMKVDDKDNSRNELKVYVSLNGYNKDTPEDYGDEDIYTHRFNFGKNGLNLDYNGDVIKIYIIVEDPEHNETRKTLTYRIHNNQAPTISKNSAVTRRDKDVYHDVPLNMLTAKVKLIVSDDLDNNSKLLVCLKESPTNETYDSCNDYRPFYKIGNNGGYFSTENTMEYLFHNCSGGKCKRDGSTHYLTIFVKDTYGEVSKKKFSYKFSVNKPPEIKTYEIESDGEACSNDHYDCPVEEKGGSKRILVRVTAVDDVDDANPSNDMHMNIRIGDQQGSGMVKYKDYLDTPIIYNINGTYDGSTRTIEISAKDSEGEESQIKFAKYKLYKNQPPTIEEKDDTFIIESVGAACINSEACPVEAGGSKKVYVYLNNVYDDINGNKDKNGNETADLSVAFSVDPQEPPLNRFVEYKKIKNKTYIYTLTHTDGTTQDYDGKEHIVYVWVRDEEGSIATTKSDGYLLYESTPPELQSVSFISKGTRPASGSLNTTLNIIARDDVDTAAELRFQIIEDGVVTHNNLKLSDYMGKDNEIRLAGTHDGKTRKIEVKVFDNDSGTDSKTQNYTVYEGRPPEIGRFELYSDGDPCLNDIYCPSEDGENYNAKYVVQASDDIDNNKDIQICVSEDAETCDNYTSYSNYLTGNTPKEVTYRFNADSNTPYDGSTRNLYLYVKDTDQNVVKSSKTYKLYKNKKPVITENPKINKNVNDPNMNYPDITYKIDAEDDLDTNLQIQYCYKKDGGEEECTDYEDFKKSKVLNNDFFKVTRPSGETFVIYSKIKDSYGAVTKSDEITYKLYTDIAPIIYQQNITSGKRIYKDSEGNVLESIEGVENPESYSKYTRLNIKFSVDDPYDKYSVCISSNSESCSNYHELFDANNCIESSCDNARKLNSVVYDTPGFIEDGKHFKLYLFVKDTYNVVSSTALYDDTYNECDYYSDDDITYEYVFDSELTNSTYNHSDPITMVKCAGKCYYYNPVDSTTNDVFAMYKSRITYVDKFNSNITCNQDNPEEANYSASCSFKDCFYKNGSYIRKAIGTRLIPDEEPWIEVIDENIYSCTGHYKLYLSSYTVGDKDISLTETNTKICNTALDNGEYDFDSTSSDPYVRIAD